jgi:hypothetical protein
MVSFLQVFKRLCYNLYDAPELVGAICEKIGHF